MTNLFTFAVISLVLATNWVAVTGPKGQSYEVGTVSTQHVATIGYAGRSFTNVLFADERAELLVRAAPAFGRLSVTNLVWEITPGWKLTNGLFVWPSP